MPTGKNILKNWLVTDTKQPPTWGINPPAPIIKPLPVMPPFTKNPFPPKQPPKKYIWY
jgi:hypothetical protein